MSDVLQMPEPEGLTPIERTMWMVHTRPEVLDYMAWQAWYNASDYFPNGLKAKAVWDSLGEPDRQPWRDRVIADLEAYAAMSGPERRLTNRNALLNQLRRGDAAYAAHVAASPARTDK